MNALQYEIIFRGLRDKYGLDGMINAFNKLYPALDAEKDTEWITVKGNHIPIKPGQSPKEAITEHFKQETDKTSPSVSDYNNKVSKMYKEAVLGAVHDFEKYDYRRIDEKENKKLKADLGLDLFNYAHSITNTGIKHALNKHGNEETESQRGQEAINEKDLQLIPTITKEYDSVQLSPEKSEGRPILIYKKKIGSDYVYLEMVLGKQKKELRFKDLWKFKTKKKEGENTL